MKLTIGIKHITSFMLILLLMIILAIFLVNTSQNFLKHSVGMNSIFLAEEMLKRISLNIYRRAEELQSHARYNFIKNILLQSNKNFQKIIHLQKYINQMDKEWISTPKNVITPFIQEILNNELSLYLRKDLIEFYKEKYGYSIYSEIFVTNKYGVIIASTGKTSDYLQSDEEWYQKARMEKNFWISSVEYDESAGVFANSIVINLYDDNNNFIGIFKAVLDTSKIVREVEIIEKTYETTRIILFTDKGRLIYRSKVFKFFSDISNKEFYKKIKGERGFYVAREGGKKILFSYAHSRNFRNFKELGWILMINHEIDEVLKPAFKLRNKMIIASFIIITIGIIFALLMSHTITKPILNLKRRTEVIGTGNLNYMAKINTQDEIGQLSQAFDKMTENLKRTTVSRDKLLIEIKERKKIERELRNLKEELEIKITERTKELTRKTVELEAINKELEAFCYSVSHDLRAPLRSMSGFSEILLEEYSDKLDKEGKDYLNRIYSSSQKMGKLIDDLLSLSRITRYDIISQIIDINDMVKKIVNEIKKNDKVRKVDFVIKDTPKVESDINLLYIAMKNLFHNAWKFTSKKLNAKIEFGFTNIEKKGVYFISDNGAGFDMKYADKLFGAFQRLHTDKEFPGTGIGLAIVKRIFNKLGGEIWAKAKEGEGATFYFVLTRVIDENQLID